MAARGGKGGGKGSSKRAAPKRRTSAKGGKGAKGAKGAKSASGAKARARKPKAAAAPEAAPAPEVSAEVAAAPATATPATTTGGLPASKPIAEDGAILLEDWTPMGQCLDWRAGLQTWAVQAEQLFDAQRVPNLAHDNGSISERNAAVLAAWCAEQGDALPERIVVVELGMGTGLHLRFALDRFTALCGEGGHDWAERLEVYATDVSRGVLTHARDRGLFAAYGERVHLGGMNALQPGQFLPLDGEEAVDLGGRIHVAWANYVLDLMPMDLFRRRLETSGTEWQAVLARTWLADPERLQAYTDLDLDGVQAALAAKDYRPLSDLFPLTEVELRTFPVDLESHPDHAAIARMADHVEAALGPDHALLAEGSVVVHSGGALRVAARVGRALAPTGYATFRDVGLTTAELAAVPRTYSHYGPTSAAGVNMVELDDWFAAGGDGAAPALRSVAPEQDGPRHQASRLITAAALPATEAAFAEHFGAASFAETEALVSRARATEDTAEAVELFRQALAREPRNWALMLEAAQRGLRGGLDPQLAVLLCRQGLALNPEYSPDLWTVYGDALWSIGDKGAARRAYAFSLDVNPKHAEGHYGVAFCDAERGRFDSALRHVGEALAADDTGRLRAKVLQLLDACLRGQARRSEDERARIARRARR